MKKLFVLALFLIGFSAAYSQTYNRAIGLRLSWDYGLSYKQFLNEKAAIEGVLSYRSYGGAGYKWNYFRIMGLYLIHNPFPNVEGLQWYYGGGASVLSFGGDYKDRYVLDDVSSIGIGIHGAIGLDYKFANAPINLTIDWIPTFTIGSYYDGFAGDYGALAVRYTF